MFVARGGSCSGRAESNLFWNGVSSSRQGSRSPSCLSISPASADAGPMWPADKPVRMRRVFDGLQNFILLFGKKHARKLKLRAAMQADSGQNDGEIRSHFSTKS